MYSKCFNTNVFRSAIYFNGKNPRFFYNRSYMTIRPLCNILLTIWFIGGISFSISTSFEEKDAVFKPDG